MSRRAWANPNPANNTYTRQGNLTTDVILVDSRSQPTSSPAPAPGTSGNLLGIVPQGWIQQIGSDMEVDTMLAQIVGGVTRYRANISQFVVPYISGGWPPDPQAGQPGHTPQTQTGTG